jgi:hypothetical protein
MATLNISPRSAHATSPQKASVCDYGSGVLMLEGTRSSTGAAGIVFGKSDARAFNWAIQAVRPWVSFLQTSSGLLMNRANKRIASAYRNNKGFICL